MNDDTSAGSRRPSKQTNDAPSGASAQDSTRFDRVAVHIVELAEEMRMQLALLASVLAADNAGDADAHVVALLSRTAEMHTIANDVYGLEVPS
jgi:hypothetical protein